MKKTDEQRRAEMLEAIRAIAEVLPLRLLKKLYYLALEYATEL